MADLAKPAQIKEHIETVKELLARSDVQKHLTSVLPEYLTPQRLIAVAVLAIQRSPGLHECTPLSLASCIVQCADLHLTLDPFLGWAYLVPFKNKHTGRKEAQLMPGYKGLIELAYRSADVRYVTSEIVRETDVFNLLYTEAGRGYRHEPCIRRRGQPEVGWIGAYAVAYWRDSKCLPAFEFMDEDDIAKIRARSKAADSGPWVTDTEAMWRKTPIRRLAKFLPVSVTDNRLLRAATLDEAREHGVIEAHVTRPEDVALGLDALTFAPEGAATPEGANNSESAGTNASEGKPAGSEEEILRYRVKELGKSLGYNEAKVNMLLGQHAGRLPALIEDLQYVAKQTKPEAMGVPAGIETPKQGPREVKQSGKPNPRFTF